jgi:acetyl esterase/lipase
MKKRWKFLIVVITLVIGSGFGIAYFLFSNDAPIVTGSITRNIEYKPGLRLDVYAPTQQRYNKTPVVLYIHGGAWIGGMKEGLNFNRFNQTANDLRASGYAIVSINYTLAETNQSPFPTCIEDAADAVAWIHENATAYNFDLSNVGLFGESAGAHIAMMIAYNHASYTLKEYPQARFNYVVDIYGPNQLQNIYHAPTIDTLYSKLAQLPDRLQSHLDVAKYIFGFDPKQDSVRAQKMMEEYSPYNYLTSSAPPTLIIQGDKDRVVPLDQSITLLAKLDSLGVENEIHIVNGADHGFIKATPEQKLTQQKWVVKFIQRHYTSEG